MSHSELAIAGLFDHEHDAPKRHIADWGGDDVFASPDRRRRFDREPELADHHEPVDDWERAALAVAEERSASGREPMARDWDLETGQHEPAAAMDAPVSHPGEYLEPIPEGRRTVTITGHPGDRAFATPRRPSRSLDERIAHAPERIAGWAFGLGLLLIIIAIATSH